eukprot:3362356-Rhodomonas_salina.1
MASYTVCVCVFAPMIYVGTTARLPTTQLHLGYSQCEARDRSLLSSRARILVPSTPMSVIKP